MDNIMGSATRRPRDSRRDMWSLARSEALLQVVLTRQERAGLETGVADRTTDLRVMVLARDMLLDCRRLQWLALCLNTLCSLVRSVQRYEGPL